MTVFQFFKTAVPSITPKEAKAQSVEKNAIYIDVRTPEEYQGKRIPGSVNIPLDEIETVQRVVSQKDATLFVYCLSGARASSACHQLVKMGYTQVYNLGGITGWPYETVSGKDDKN